jgi:hypothetical protein
VAIILAATALMPASTKFEKKIAEMNKQPAFLIAGGQGQKIKLIRVLENLFSQI